MSRRRSTPWIYRWSRPLIGAIAVVGAILTAYLTYTKFSGAAVGCAVGAGEAAGGCNNVLNSEYAEIFGLPLSLFGCLAYTGMAGAALAPLAVSRESNRSFRKQLEEWTWLLLLAGAVGMTVFSGYLMYLLAFELQTLCPYCLASAAFSLSFLVLTLAGRDWEDIGQMVFVGFVVGLVTLIGIFGVYSGGQAIASGGDEAIPIAEAPQPPPPTEPGVSPAITTNSGEAEIALAQHLSEIGAKNYGAYWCPHCYEQKQLFGEAAFSQIDYVECAPDGKKARPQQCVDAGIQSYPTWEINGKFYRGTQTLQQLANASGYQGPSDFKYTLSER